MGKLSLCGYFSDHNVKSDILLLVSYVCEWVCCSVGERLNTQCVFCTVHCCVGIYRPLSRIEAGVKSRRWVLRCHCCFHITTVLTVVCRDDIITIWLNLMYIMHYLIIPNSFQSKILAAILFFKNICFLFIYCCNVCLCVILVRSFIRKIIKFKIPHWINHTHTLYRLCICKCPWPGILLIFIFHV